MSDVSRRTFLAGSAGVTAATLGGATLAGPALAQAPAQTAPAPAASPAISQTPSAHRYKVGDVVVTAVSDGSRRTQ